MLSHLCLGLFLVAFYFGQRSEWPMPWAAAAIVALGVVVYSLFSLHLRTGLWRMVHAKADDLDERQIQVSLASLRQSSAIFTVGSLGVMLYAVYAYRGETAFAMLVFASLLYLAHTLPSSILAWTEKDI